MHLPRGSKRGSLHGETMTSDPVNLLNCFAVELDWTLSLRHGQESPGRPARARQASRRSQGIAASAAHTPWARWESQASEAAPPRPPAASRLAWLSCSSLQYAL